MPLALTLGFVLSGCLHRGPLAIGRDEVVIDYPRKVEVNVVRSDADHAHPPVMTTFAATLIRYPYEMSRSGQVGEVVAKLIVGEDGVTKAVEIEETIDSRFASPVIEGLKKCVFLPAKRDGNPVRCLVWCRVRFRDSNQ